jgi:hypothetical protein
MAHSYAEAYSLYCQSTIETLQVRLGREVSPQERRCIWNVGSLMMLESVERLFQEGALAAVERELSAMPQWTDERFQRGLSSVLEQFPKWLGRPATDSERQALGRIEHIGALESFAERLTSVSPDQREAVLRDALSPLL